MKDKLGEIFISDSILSEEELNEILKQYNLENKDIGIALFNLGYLDQKQLESAMVKKIDNIIKETEIVLVLYQNLLSPEKTLEDNFDIAS